MTAQDCHTRIHEILRQMDAALRTKKPGDVLKTVDQAGTALQKEEKAVRALSSRDRAPAAKHLAIARKRLGQVELEARKEIAREKVKRRASALLRKSTIASGDVSAFTEFAHSLDRKLPEAELLEVVRRAMMEAIKETTSDKKYFLSKLKVFDQAGSSLRRWLKDLGDELKGGH